jgi:hypothetical protein
MFPNSLISLTQTLANTCYRLFLFIFIMRTHAPFQFAAAREGKDHPRIRQHAQAKCWRQYGEACAAFFTHLRILILSQPSGGSSQSPQPGRQSQGILAGKA